MRISDWSSDVCSSDLLLDVLRRDPLGGIEALHLSRDAGGEGRCVEMRDRADPGAAVDDAVPARRQAVADRGPDAETRADDATLGHCLLRCGFDCDARAASRRKPARNPRGRNRGPGWHDTTAGPHTPMPTPTPPPPSNQKET